MKSCFIVPVHKPRFSPYGLDLVRSYNKYFDDTRLHLVFTNQDEATIFSDMLDTPLKYTPIICTENLEYSKPISQKKIFGVRWVFDFTDYDTAAVIDIDSEFIRSVDYDSLFEQYLSQNSLYSSKVNNKGMRDIVGRAAAEKFYSPEDVGVLSEITDNFQSYFWFNDIPIYQKKYFFDFLDYIDYNNSIPKLEYTTFDFILYAYYLLIKGFIKLHTFNIDGVGPAIQDKGSFLEAQSHWNKDYFESVFRKYKPMWIKDLIAEDAMENVFIKLHTDRK